MVSIVETALLENIDNPASLFIFPTDVAASRWADRLLRLRRGGTIAMDKFIAWDTFKQNSIRTRLQNKKSIPSVLRKMFTSVLIRENADLYAKGQTPVFASLIRPEWAGKADSSLNWLTGILPQLGIWFRQAAGLSISQIADNQQTAEKFSGDDLDLFNLAMRYRQFLEKYGLFEPAWESPPFEDAGKECFIFFPESLSDFSEYRKLLETSGHVKIIEAHISEAEEQVRDVFYYTNSRSEITEAALYIEALHNNKNISWDSISVSIPDKEYYSPYLFREFNNRNIPYIKQSATPLASYPAGKLFSAIALCASGDFSFASLTELFLNRHLPWKQDRDIQSLINFGINNNCISSWTEEESGKETRINVWEDAFMHPYHGIAPETKKFFDDAKWQINALRHADSFSEIRKQYFAFRRNFFDMDRVLEETGTILSRCISELMYLTEIEKDFPDLHVPDPFAFFVSHLEETSYLAQQRSSGVSILPYRTAAPAPFDCHIILGASQEALTAIFSPLAFLSRSRREKLGLSDEDASKTFIRLHQFNSLLPAAFFCSEQTFSGYAIPHNALAAAGKPKQRFGDDSQHGGKFAPDLYSMETAFHASLHFPAAGKMQAEPAMSGKIHKNQKQGFEKWLLRRKDTLESGSDLSGETGLQGGVSGAHPLLQMIRRRFCGRDEFKGKLSVSASSLAPYFECPHKWIFERVLELENVEIETRLMAGNTTGIVFHAILNLFLNELKKTNKAIEMPVNSEGYRWPSVRPPVYTLPKLYSDILKKNIETVFDSFPKLPNSPYQEMSILTARLLRAQQELFTMRLENFLTAFISFFHGFRVIATETTYRLHKEFYFLNGKVDCILEDARDGLLKNNPLLLVDFKTTSKGIPGLYTAEGELADFQLPMYLRLAKSSLGKEVHTALFFSIMDMEVLVLFGTINDARSGAGVPKKEEDTILHGSDDYESIMNKFDEKAEQFAAEISKAAFPVYPVYSSCCLKCSYNAVCRTLYKICQGKSDGR